MIGYRDGQLYPNRFRESRGTCEAKE